MHTSEMHAGFIDLVQSHFGTSWTTKFTYSLRATKPMKFKVKTNSDDFHGIEWTFK